MQQPDPKTDRRINSHKFFIARDGATYAMDRPAVREADGAICLDQLRNDEVVLSSGLIYRRVQP